MTGEFEKWSTEALEIITTCNVQNEKEHSKIINNINNLTQTSRKIYKGILYVIMILVASHIGIWAYNYYHYFYAHANLGK